MKKVTGGHGKRIQRKQKLTPAVIIGIRFQVHTHELHSGFFISTTLSDDAQDTKVKEVQIAIHQHSIDGFYYMDSIAEKRSGASASLGYVN